MAIIQVVPHSLVGLEASVVFIQFSDAFEAVPVMSMGVGHAECRLSPYKIVAMGPPEMVDHFAQIPGVEVVAKAIRTDIRRRHLEYSCQRCALLGLKNNHMGNSAILHSVALTPAPLRITLTSPKEITLLHS